METDHGNNLSHLAYGLKLTTTGGGIIRATPPSIICCSIGYKYDPSLQQMRNASFCLTAPAGIPTDRSSPGKGRSSILDIGIHKSCVQDNLLYEKRDSTLSCLNTTEKQNIIMKGEYGSITVKDTRHTILKP